MSCAAICAEDFTKIIPDDIPGHAVSREDLGQWDVLLRSFVSRSAFFLAGFKLSLRTIVIHRPVAVLAESFSYECETAQSAVRRARRAPALAASLISD